MRFRILGPLEVWDDDEQPVALSRRLHRSTLSLLLLNAGQPCSINSLVAALWPDTPPLSPEVSLRSCIYGIRKLLPDGRRVQTHPSGYLIGVKPGELDLLSFRELVIGGRDALDSGNPLDAAKALTEALALWRDPPLADLPDIHEKDKLLDQRREVQDALIDANLALGRHRQVLPELRSVVTADPLREHAWAQLMLALYRSGARAEALSAFGRLRITLVTTYGIEPGPELQELHRQVLVDDPALMPRPAADLVTATVTPVVTPTVTRDAELVPARYPVKPPGRPDNGLRPTPMMMSAPVPADALVSAPPPPLRQPACQLPAAVADFTGRSAELDELLGRLPAANMAVTILSGMPGVGKTALAVHAAHLAKARFPDGQLCAWLDDCGVARDPQVVLGELLRGLGFPAGEIPVSRFEREAMYRSALAERKVLVLVDGASSAAQVRPLLPSTAGSAVLVTSRSRLADIDGAKTIELTGMIPADAVTLLSKISGRDLAAPNTGSAAAESANTAAASTGPDSTGPASTGSAYGGSANGGPASTGSAYGGSANGGPASTGPAHQSSANSGPASTGPAHQSSANSGPASTGPAHQSSANSGPASTGPAHQSSANGGPASTGPAYGGSANGGSAGTGSAGTGSAGTGSAGTGSAGTGSAGTGSAGTGSAATASVILLGTITGRELAGQDRGSAGAGSADTASADIGAALSIAASCGYLPLALRIAGARLADDPGLPMARLAGLLANEHRRLDELSLGDQSIRARLATATQTLSAPARTVLALLAAAGSRDTPGWLIASLLEEPAASLVGPALANAGLLSRVPGAPADGTRGTFYRMHPLVRAYASELLADANRGIIGAATGRLLASGWLELANGGEVTMLDQRQRTPIRPS